MSSPAGIDCGSDCDEMDSQIVTCVDLDCPDPDPDDWTTYTLTASAGPSGFAPSWSGCDSASGATCIVKNDTSPAVHLGWNDVTNPSVTLASPGKVGGSMSVTAAASDNAEVANVEFLVDGVPKLTDITAPYGGFIDMSGYSDGSTHTVAARATDTSNRFTIVTRSVTVDRSVSLTLGSLPAFTNAASVPLTFSTDDDVTSIRCRLNGGASTICSSPYSPISAATPDGSYTYGITVIDDVGNTASAPRSFVLDRTQPTASFTDGPGEGGIVGTSSIKISFAYADANLDSVQCKFDGGAFGACTAADSETLNGLTDGAHTFSLRATDKAGNVREITRTFVVALPAGGSAGGPGTPTTTGAGPATGTLGVLPVAGGGTAAGAKLSSRFGRRGRSTVVRRLRLIGLPSNSRVTIRCHGRGCPFKSKTYRRKGGKLDLSRRFRHHRLRRGARLEIRVYPPAGPKQVFRLTMRAGKKPRIRAS